jgi:hypothetical protein
VENMYENMQHNIVCTTHVGTLPFILVVLKPCKYRKPICVPKEAKPGILITQCPDNRIPLLLQNLLIYFRSSHFLYGLYINALFLRQYN